MSKLICVCVLVLVLGRSTRAFCEASAEAQGELAARIAMVHDRFAEGRDPAFTDDFILADVALRPDYPRRFSEFSGDVSGRYLDSMAALPPRSGADLGPLVGEILKCQRADGRFGDAALSFAPEDVGREQMALLWGNGRLLVGLLEYYGTAHDPATLDAARRLGDFLLSIQEACSNKETAERLVKEAANGFICFTQLIEGLVLLHQATGDAQYLDGATRIVDWFQQPRGVQHTHGYLTTVRGIMMLYGVTQKPEYLKLAADSFQGIVESPDYLIFGGVPEYFSNTDNRDEGCSEADFLRLSLQLWHATEDAKYLEYAERILLNQFYGNQFDTGDFGHHVLTDFGIGPCTGIGRAWWCCTMHCLRACRDVLDALASTDGDIVRVNLFLDATWSNGEVALRLTNRPGGLSIAIDSAPDREWTLAVRQPTWADPLGFSVNGAAIEASAAEGCRTVRRTWKAGDTLDVVIPCRTRLITRDGRTLEPGALGGAPVQAALFYGPWLLGVDSEYDPMFFGEPWEANMLELPSSLAATASNDDDGLLAVPGAHFTLDYVHGGFPDPCRATLRPYSEQTRHEQGIFAVWLRFRNAPTPK